MKFRKVLLTFVIGIAIQGAVYIYLDSVLFAPLVMTLGRSKALKVSMVRNSTDTSIVGFSKGIVIEKKLRTLPHPSTFAAS